jgi:hypothetical protein
MATRNAATTTYPSGESKGTAGFTRSAPAAARNRGKSALAKGPPPYGGPKGKGGLATPRAPGAKAAKPPITGPMQGLRGRKK